MNNFRNKFSQYLFALICSTGAVTVAEAALTDLSDQPLFTSAAVAGNLLLTLSVEYPTADGPAYPSTVAYSSTNEYVGYFDQTKCYTYFYDSVNGVSSSYFKPYSTPSTAKPPLPAVCTSTSTIALWSGNFLNWATQSAVDPFRSALTGGFRAVDTAPGAGPAKTILERAWQSVGQGSYGSNSNSDFPDHLVSGASTIAGATPFQNISCLAIRSGGLGNLSYFTAVDSSGSCPNSGDFEAKSSTIFPISGPTQNSDCYGDSGPGNCSVTTGSPKMLQVTAATTNPASDIVNFTGKTFSSSSQADYGGVYGCAFSSTTSASSNPNICAGQVTSDSTTIAGTIYEIAIRVQVCDPTMGGTVTANESNLEPNCTAYVPIKTSATAYNYKPEGLMQQNALKVRYGVFGYMNDSGNSRDGGVLRSNMKFVGPQIPVPGSSPTANTTNEWDPNTGVYIINPNPTDVTNTNNACKTANSGATSCATTSGVLNYVNSFGEAAHIYKSADPLGELYYAGVRYFKNLGNVTNWSDMKATNSSPNVATLNAYTDGFPVITSWNDPIQYACQKNFILGIGDVNTHADGDLPHDPKFNGDTNNPAWSKVQSQINADPVNTQSTTNTVGVMEKADTFSGPLSVGTTGTGLGDTTVPWCCGDTNNFGMVGIAYDAHVNDLRPKDFLAYLNPDGNKTFKQTITTYFLDVQEYQNFHYQNQFWLATKYGGFNVPKGYAFGTALQKSWWDVNNLTEKDGAGFAGTTRSLPDNYFPASNATGMVNGLKRAFANISSQISATTTAFATVKPQVQVSGNASFSASYDSGTWTGSLIGNSLSFDSSGAPSETAIWNARDTLESSSSGTGWSTRVILTNNGTPGNAGSSALGIVLNSTNLTNATYVGALKNNCADLNATNCINFLRGDRSNEGANGNGSYRTRAFLLGDIADSQVAPVGPPSGPFLDGSNPGYSSFISTHATRPVVVYVSTNDGMLHAFDGSVASGHNGAEYFSYVPSYGFQGPGTTGPGSSTFTPGVNGLPSYGKTPFVHHFYADGSPVVSDVDFANTNGAGGSGNWHSVLIGSLGKGGAGYYALDVTDPTGVASSPGPKPATQASSFVIWEFTDPDMGYTYGDATVVKTKKYGWVVLLTSGYNNPSGVGKIYIVNPTNGSLLQTLSTAGNTDPKAVKGTTSSPAGLAWVSGFSADFTDGTVDSAYAGDLFGQIWRFDLTGTPTSYPVPTLFATLTAADGTRQPVTTRPLIEVDSATAKRYVLVGTGQELGNSDISSAQLQDFYAIIDGTNAKFTPTAAIPSGGIVRSLLFNDTALLTTTGTKTAPASDPGFYIDLNGSSGASYRVNTTPTANNGVVGFAANLPTGDVCAPSGSNQTYAFRFGGSGVGQSVLLDSSGNLTAYTSGSGAVTNISFINVAGKIELLVGTDLAGISAPKIKNPNSLTFKLLNWQEVIPSN
jgi:type IV pilus assembly protein PilY1